MTTKQRWISGVLLGLGLTAIGAAAFFIGLLPAAVSTGACPDLPGWAVAYLSFFWPGMMLVGSLVPAVMVIRGARWYRPVIAVIGFGLVNTAIYAGWFGVRAVLCG